MKRANRLFILGACLTAFAAAASAQEVVAVLGSEQRAHRETYESILAVFGKPVLILQMGKALPAGAKFVLAFGGKAAIQHYPGRVTLIYAVAPGLSVDRKTHDGPSVKIMMEPEAAALLGKLKSIQPELKRLAVLWSSSNQAASVERLVKGGAARGVEVSAEQLEDPSDLPGRLRELKGKIDAIWLSPDPALINAHTFDIVKHFAYDNDIPFYAPTEGLAEQGAVAAVFVTYKEMGRMMAAAAKDMVAGKTPPAELYTDRVHLSINGAAAAASGLSLPANAVP